jgi:hypothetical protein
VPVLHRDALFAATPAQRVTATHEDVFAPA